MNSALNEDERLIRRAGPRFRFRCVGRRAAPRVIFAVEKGEFVVVDGVAAVGVDGGSVGGCGDVEGVAADDGFVGEGDGARDEGELVFGDGGAWLEEAPLAAVLVRPASPSLSDVVQGVESSVVRGVAFIRCLAPCNTGLDGGYVEIADEVQHLRCERCGLRSVAAGRHQLLDCACQTCGCRMEGAIGCNVSAILREGRIVHGRIPIATLPACYP